MKRTALLLGASALCLPIPTVHAEPATAEVCAPVEHRLKQVSTVVERLEAERESLCSAAQNFARALTQGRVETRELAGCMGSEARRALSEQLAGWRNATSALTALDQYAAGETDRSPQLAPGGNTQVEQVIANLLAQGEESTPLVYRRLLVEAMEIVAPQAWQQLREGGADELERWFASTAPLEPTVLQEAQRGVEVQGHGGALSTALSMVHVYQRLARCHEPQPASYACERAEQLTQALESNEPLLLRRRTQDIWSTDCSAVNPETLRLWVQDIPGISASKANEGGRGEVLEAARNKLYTCFLRDVEAGESFEAWQTELWPRAEQLKAGELRQLDQLRQRASGPVEELRCTEAARALQSLPPPSSCSLPASVARPLMAWVVSLPSEQTGDASMNLRICSRFVQALWEGRAVTLPPSFSNAPAPSDALVTVPNAPPTGMERLREQCAARSGPEAAFPTSVLELSQIGEALGEAPGAPPWLVDPQTQRPIEAIRFGRAQTPENWLNFLLDRASTCTALDMVTERCGECRNLPPDAHYDCALLGRLETQWTRDARQWTVGLLTLVALLLMASWLRRLLHTRREFGSWSREAIKSLADLGLPLRPDPLRWVFPSRFQVLTADLPSDPAWERWGKRAVLLRASRGRLVHARDVNRTAQAAHAAGAEFALLVHDAAASLDLAAVRAVLEWAAKGGTRAVHVLPISSERLQWSRSPDDLLDLVEEGSLRQNPFEVRGRIQSSQQFFNRERLVSGLLASVQAGHFTVVTGLRRFGKSSLALEVGRRTPGPTAYVDLAGFYDEFARPGDPARAADAVLRYVCVQLNDAAAHRYPGVQLPPPPPEAFRLDATALATWFRDFGDACSAAHEGRPTTLLLILDELEQAIAVGAERLEHALTVLAIVIGRLRNALPGTGLSQGGTRVGMLLCSAIDPLLWAPLGTLAHQSLMGSFSAVCVPCLPEEAAVAMMRGLGARHGIRFTDPAIEYIVREAQGIPLLVRRIGSAVLELYDPERARQGSLGAVEVGIEGATTAVAREEQEGSPLRVWIESEIANDQSPAGTVLRKLALSEACPALELRAITTEHILQRFAETGIEATLSTSECRRRAEEASGVLLRLLHESGLLIPHGDLTNPDAYELPEGVVRRVLIQAAHRGSTDRSAPRPGVPAPPEWPTGSQEEPRIP